LKNYKETLTIDGEHFNNLDGFYDEIAKVFTDGSYPIGHSLDAFIDLLIGGNGVYNVGDNVLVRWKNSSKSRKDLGYNATVKYYEDKIKLCHSSNTKNFQKKLDDAKLNTGDTIFDIICKIFKEPDIYEHSCSLELK